MQRNSARSSESEGERLGPHQRVDCKGSPSGRQIERPIAGIRIFDPLLTISARRLGLKSEHRSRRMRLWRRALRGVSLMMRTGRSVIGIALWMFEGGRSPCGIVENGWLQRQVRR